MSDEVTEELFTQALDVCWRQGGQPTFMRTNWWFNFQMQDFLTHGNCRRSEIMFKAVKRAERLLSYDYNRRAA